MRRQDSTRLAVTNWVGRSADYDVRLTGRVENISASETGLHYLPKVRTRVYCLGPGNPDSVDKKHKVVVEGQMPAKGECDTGKWGGVNLGPVAADTYVCSNCACTVHNALCNRHCSKQAQITGNFDAALQHFKKFETALYEAYERSYETLYHNWIDKWNVAKRELIRTALRESISDDTRLKPFPKRECNHAMPSKGRLIQPYYDLDTQARTAPVVCAMQKAFGEVFGQNHQGQVDITFASGMNAGALGDWMRDTLDCLRDVHFYERDGKNWDANIQRLHWQLKMAVYRMMTGDSDVLKVLEDCFKGHATMHFEDCTIKYTVEGTVKSGHNDTSLGNSIINAAIAYQAAVVLGLRARILVMGDDLLMAVEGDFDAKKLSEEEAKLGIVPVYAKFSDYRDVSFISCYWWPTGNVDHPYATSPKIGRCLARLFWCTKDIPPKLERAWIHTVVCGLKGTCIDLPILGDFLQVCDELADTDKTCETGKYDWEGRDAFKVRYDPDLLLDTFKYRYGSNDAEVAQLEDMILSITSLNTFMKHDLIDRMLAYDCADPHERPVGG